MSLEPKADGVVWGNCMRVKRRCEKATGEAWDRRTAYRNFFGTHSNWRKQTTMYLVTRVTLLEQTKDWKQIFALAVKPWKKK